MSLYPLKLVTDIPSEYVPDLEWSMGPLFLYMKISGVPIGQSSSSSWLRRKLVLCGGTIMVMWTITGNIFNLLSLEPYPNQGKWVGTLWRLIGPLVNISVTMNLFWLAHMQWKSLWNTAIEIEEALRFDLQFYRSLRRTTSAAAALLVLVKQRQTSHLIAINTPPQS